MTEYKINLTGDQAKGLLTNDDGLKELIEEVTNQVLDSPISKHLTAVLCGSQL